MIGRDRQLEFIRSNITVPFRVPSKIMSDIKLLP
jgi:hypothetical protein